MDDRGPHEAPLFPKKLMEVMTVGAGSVKIFTDLGTDITHTLNGPYANR